ncbi:MAG TPA: hemerythrin family protein [Bacteroidales bacterium]|nr:hemerythrin family protein [Bacteroidales bacterium]
MKTTIDPKKSWNDRYALGIPLLDKQHQQFSKILDKLSLIRETSYPDDLVEEVIAELKAYSIYHFKSEERILSELSSDNLENQVKQHQVFIKKIEEFENAFRYKNMVLVNQMLLFLRKWFVHHISAEDPKYVESIVSARPDLRF